MAKVAQDAILKELMSTSLENLAKRQHDRLLEVTIDRLNAIVGLLKAGKYPAVKGMLIYSESGDDHGQANYYIGFDIGGKEPVDLYDVVDKLQSLKAAASTPESIMLDHIKQAREGDGNE